MNVDQIIDKRTVAIPGPQGKTGKPGEQGLPGVNAVPADQAVAGYISTGGASQTKSALGSFVTSMRPAVAVTDFGIDNTGSKDCSGDINALIADNPAGLWFPPGTYLLSKPLATSYASVFAADGARFIATDDMDAMLDVAGSDDRHIEVSGGYWHGQMHADTIIRSEVMNLLSVRHMFLRGGKVSHLDLSRAHAATVDGLRIDGEYRDVTGLITNYDSQFDRITIHGCATGIDTQGMNQFSNVYVWGGMQQSNRHTIGFRLANGSTLVFSNMYIDCNQSGFKSLPGQNTTRIVGQGLFTYAEPTDIDPSISMVLFDMQENDRVDISDALYAANRATAFSVNKLEVGHLGDLMSFKSDIDRDIYMDYQHFATIKNLSLAGTWTKPYLQTTFTFKEGYAVRVCTVNQGTNEDIDVRSVFGDTIYRGINTFDGKYQWARTDNYNATVTLWKTTDTTTNTVSLWLYNEHVDKGQWSFAVRFNLIAGWYGDGYINCNPQQQQGLPDGAVKLSPM